MKTSLRTAVLGVISAAALTLTTTLSAGTAHAATFKDRTGDVTSLGGAKASTSAEFKALTPSVDIKKVKVIKRNGGLVVTATVVDLPDPTSGTGPVLMLGAGEGLQNAIGYYTIPNPIFDGVQSGCGATGSVNVAANQVAVVIPKTCFEKGATRVARLTVTTAGYDGVHSDLPSDSVSIRKAFKV